MKLFCGVLAIAAVLLAQPKTAWTPAEKPIYDQIRTLRSLPDDTRTVVTRELALKIRALPLTPGKQTLAIQLANLVTEGDPGRQTLEQTATTLAAALKEQPSPMEEPYVALAQLARYEHINVTLDDPRYRSAMAGLVTADKVRSHLDFTLSALDGRSWTLSQLKGKIVVVNFWATWCPPCRKEMPDLDSIYKDFRDKGLVILAISDEDRATVQSWLPGHEVSYPILLDPGRQVNEHFMVRGIPKTFVYDRAGHLAAQSIDMRTRSQFLDMLRRAGL